MDIIFWIVQGLGLLTLVLTIISFFQKEKWKIMLYLTISNAVLVVTYILCNDILGGVLVVGALIRTLVYFFYSKFNKKPKLIVVILFEMYFIIISILMWHGPITLFMIINLIILTYTTWQEDVKILRFGYVLSSVLLFAYDILLGAYLTAVSEIIMLISVVISIKKYSKTTTPDKNITKN